jgi:hypothetical protein
MSFTGFVRVLRVRHGGERQGEECCAMRRNHFFLLVEFMDRCAHARVLERCGGSPA